MVTVAIVLLLILVGVFISCCIFLGKRLEEEEPTHAGDVEGFESFPKVSQPVFPWKPRPSLTSTEPPRQPRGSSVSTSFAAGTSQKDVGAGIYRRSVYDVSTKALNEVGTARIV